MVISLLAVLCVLYLMDFILPITHKSGTTTAKLLYFVFGLLIVSQLIILLFIIIIISSVPTLLTRCVSYLPYLINRIRRKK